MAGTSYDTIGRVELCINEVWGTICRDTFTDIDANVVCTQLGYSPYGKYNIYLYIIIVIVSPQVLFTLVAFYFVDFFLKIIFE